MTSNHITYYLTVKSPFQDKDTGQTIQQGDVFQTQDYERAKNIIKMRLADLTGIIHDEPKAGLRILIHQKYCYKIGGIETANSQIARAFPERNITFVFNSGDNDQIMELSKYHDVVIDNGRSEYDTDIFIMTNYDSAPEILDRVHARKVYQQIHADFQALTQMNEWRDFVWHPNPRIDKVLAVSETAQKGLKTRFDIDSVVVPNILLPAPKTRPMVFICLSRATPEKGVDRLVKLLRRFDEADKDYVLFMCSTVEQAQDSDQLYLQENPRVVTIQPTIYTRELLRAADMLIQLSYNESYCYSVREALQAGVPCLVSDCPELRKLIIDGQNGFIYDDGMSIDKIFKTKFKLKPYKEEISPMWQKVMNGDL